MATATKPKPPRAAKPATGKRVGPRVTKTGAKKTLAADPLRGVGRLVPIDAVRPSPFQARQDFDASALKGLSDSIAAHGLLQPIVVRTVNGSVTNGGPHYELIAGERRLLAAQQAGLREIPCVVRDADDQSAAVLGALENLQRAELNPIEAARAIRTALDQGLKQAEVARQLSISQGECSNRLRLLKLPGAVQEAIISGEISARHGRALLPAIKERPYMPQHALKHLRSHPGETVEDFEAWLAEQIGAARKTDTLPGCASDEDATECCDADDATSDEDGKPTKRAASPREGEPADVPAVDFARRLAELKREILALVLDVTRAGDDSQCDALATMLREAAARLDHIQG